jgi:hypothetical protein
MLAEMFVPSPVAFAWASPLPPLPPPPPID